MSSPSAPLLVLNVAPAGPVEIPSGPALERLVSRMVSLQNGVMWVRGEEGSGRSTLIERALKAFVKKQTGLLGVLRIECSPGLRIEELLSMISEFLFQLGIEEFHSALCQRTTLRAKVQLLFRVLKNHSVWIWLDDFQSMEAGCRDSDTSGLKYFASCCQERLGGRGKWLLVTSKKSLKVLQPEDIDAEVVDLAEREIVNAELYWETCRRHSESITGNQGHFPLFEDLPAAVRHSPLALRILSGSWPSLLSPSAAQPLSAKSLHSVISSVGDDLSSHGKPLLDLLSLSRRPMSHGAIRTLARRLRAPVLETKGVAELTKRGLLTESAEVDKRLRLHPTIGDIWERHLRSENLDLWSQYHRDIGTQYLETASKTRSVWDFYRGYCHFRESQDSVKAYEAQKAFVEHFLTLGYIELAKEVLQECLTSVESPYREIVAGNLAIVHKNEGDYAQAIKIYRESLAAFTARGDLGNAARVYHQIGNVYFVQEEYDKALANYRRSIELADQIKDPAVALMTRLQIANVQFAKEEYDEAITVYEEAAKIADVSKNRTMVVALYLQICQIHLKRKQFSEADSVLKAAEELATGENDLRHLLKISQLRGVLAVKMRDDETAFAQLSLAVERAKKLGDDTEKANCQIHLGALEEKRQQFKPALEFFMDARETVSRMVADVAEPAATDNLKSVLAAIDHHIQTVSDTVGEKVFQKMLRSINRPDPREKA